MTIDKDEKQKDFPKPTEPINWVQEIEDFLIVNKNEKKYIKPISRNILSYGLKKIPELRFELQDLNDLLLERFRKNTRAFIVDFKQGLYNKLTFEPDCLEIIKKYEIKPDDLHIIPDLKDFEYLIPEIDDFSINLTDYVGKLVRLFGRSQNDSLQFRLEWRKMMFQCKVCGNEFDITDPFHNIGEKYDTPLFCTNKRCRAKNKSDFRILEEKSESYEIRYFTIADLDINHSLNEKKCIILQNIDYFIEKAKNINLEGEIDVLGFLRRDITDLKKYKKEEQEFSYYIEVLDFNPRESRRINKEEVDKIRNKIKANVNYRDELIESISSYSQGIYEYFIVKLIFCLSIITGDSWWHNDRKSKYRKTLNCIIGGHTGTMKTAISEEFQLILGKINCGMIYAQDTTKIGLIPTTQRINKKNKDLVKRYGAFRYYNKKTLIEDESQYFGKEQWHSHKYLENGIITRAMDGSIISVPCELSVIQLMNYIENENESYDCSKTLQENLGPIIKNEPSNLQRFDLHYAIPPITDRIEDILGERGDVEFEEVHSDDEIFNYLMEAKRIYPSVELSNEIKNLIKKLKKYLSKTKKPNQIRTPRNLNVLKKLLKGIAALRLETKADISDLNYLKEHLIHTIIPFYDNELIASIRTVDINKIFIKTFNLLTELTETITISEHINFIREFLESHYFPNKSSKPYPKGKGIVKQLEYTTWESKIDEYMPLKTNLGDNRPYRDLLENQENVNHVENMGFIIDKKNTGTIFINIKRLQDKFLKKINEVFKVNKVKKLELNGLTQVLELEFDLKVELINLIIQKLIENKILKEKEKGYLELT